MVDLFHWRHPEITLCITESLSYARAVTNNPKIFESYFDLLEETIEINGLASILGRFLIVPKRECPFHINLPKLFLIYRKNLPIQQHLETKHTYPSLLVQVPQVIAYHQWWSLILKLFIQI